MAEKIAASYTKDSKVKVIQVSGSTGRATADKYSDLELDIYYSEEPTEDEQFTAITEAGGSHIELDDGEDEWSEVAYFHDFYMHTSTFLVSTMERYLLEMIDEASTEVLPQMRLHSLQRAISLVGHDLVKTWQAKADTYPDLLMNKMLEEHSGFRSLFYGADMFLFRDDVLMLNDVLLETAIDLLKALHGLNRIYLSTPIVIKWFDELVAEMSIKPDDFARRLKDVFRIPQVDGFKHLHELIEETYQLVAEHAASIDLNEIRQIEKKKRLAFDTSPF